MKALKIILIVLAGLVLLAIIGIAFLPDERVIERSIVVKATADKPFKLINDLKNWSKWSPWYSMDTAQIMAFSDNTEGEGAWYTWDSENKDLRKGKLTIVHSAKPDSVIVKLEFADWEAGEAGYYFEKVGEDETKVSQRMHVKANGYFYRARILLMEMGLNHMFDEGLAAIKTQAEAMPDEPAPIGRTENLGPSEMAAMMYLGYTDTTAISKLMEFNQLAYSEIMAQAGMQNLEQAGPALSKYYKWDPANDVTIVQCGMQVNKEGKSVGNVEFVKLDAQKVIAADYFGPYEGLGSVHEAIYAYAAKNGMVLNDMPFEFYMNDPSTVTDPNMLHTRVCYPIK